jgi:acyl-CoA synthetase (AMP-forming)/AMP-acid ligase II
VPDARLGEVARAYLVKGAQAQLDERAVMEWAKDKMANYKVPRSVIFLDELPMNAGGKVDKAALLQRSVQAQP